MGRKRKKDAVKKPSPFSSPSITFSASVCDIDNFKALIEFSGEILRASTGDGVVRVTGKNLEISAITDENVSVKGNIIGFEFE